MMRILLFVLVAACLGCDADAGQVLALTARDSLGVRIVEIGDPREAPLPRWALAPEPVREFGTPGDSIEIFRARDATELTDGRVAVANGGSAQVLVFGPRGLLGTVGGPGDGPSEFRSLTGLARTPGDTLVAYDSRHARLYRFLPDGSGLTSRRVELPEESAVPTLSPVGWLAGGTFVAELERVDESIRSPVDSP